MRCASHPARLSLCKDVEAAFDPDVPCLARDDPVIFQHHAIESAAIDDIDDVSRRGIALHRLQRGSQKASLAVIESPPMSIATSSVSPVVPNV